MTITLEVLSRTDVQDKIRVYAGSLNRLNSFPESSFWRTRIDECKKEIERCKVLLEKDADEFYLKDGKMYELKEIC